MSFIVDSATFTQLVPFHHNNFKNRKGFEEWLDGLGAKGWYSIAHFGALNAKDHRRLFMRRVGGPSLVVDFEIEEEKASPLTHSVEKWVPAWDKLGEEGKYPIWLYKQGGKTYVVTEVSTLDGVLQTLSWANELAGKEQAVGPKEFKSAATTLAADTYVPNTIGFSADQSDYYVVGIAEATPTRPPAPHSARTQPR